MRLGAITNGIHPCQPLRFGKAEQSKPKTPAQYEKEIAVLQKKYETACMFAAQPQAVDQFVKSAKKAQFLSIKYINYPHVFGHADFLAFLNSRRPF